MESLDRTSIIGKWFNNSLDLSDSEQTVRLFEKVKDIITGVLLVKLTDEVTADEWLSSINASIDYTNAKKVIEIKHSLDELRAVARPLNHTIGIGDIIEEYKDGSRRYLLKGDREIMDKIRNKTIDQLLDYVAAEKVYHEILYNLIAKFIKHAKEASYEDILFYADVKKLNDDIVQEEENSARRIISNNAEYLRRFKNIYEFLKSNPETLEEIENMVGTTKLLDFFNN